MKTKKTVQNMTEFAILLAIEAIFCFTPLGSLPTIGTIVMTLGMIPVVITSLILGVGYGTAMGAFAGLFSLIYFTFMSSSPVAFVFSPFVSTGLFKGNFGSIIICFVPRILTGTLPILIYKFLTKIMPKVDKLNLVISSIIGSLINTLGVLFFIWIFFSDQYLIETGNQGQVIVTVIGLLILTNGLPEALLTGIVSPIIVSAHNIIKNRKKIKES